MDGGVGGEEGCTETVCAAAPVAAGWIAASGWSRIVADRVVLCR